MLHNTSTHCEPRAQRRLSTIYYTLPATNSTENVCTLYLKSSNTICYKIQNCTPCDLSVDIASSRPERRQESRPESQLDASPNLGRNSGILLLLVFVISCVPPRAARLNFIVCRQLRIRLVFTCKNSALIQPKTSLAKDPKAHHLEVTADDIQNVTAGVARGHYRRLPYYLPAFTSNFLLMFNQSSFFYSIIWSIIPFQSQHPLYNRSIMIPLSKQIPRSCVEKMHLTI